MLCAGSETRAVPPTIYFENVNFFHARLTFDAYYVTSHISRCELNSVVLRYMTICASVLTKFDELQGLAAT